MKKFVWLLVVLSFSYVSNAQENTGIHFEQDLNWLQIFEKAKAEHKYIFVDCFATWCGPCKQMDKEVYTQKEVGDYYNEHFISVKLQMDRTGHDAPFEKEWYPIAESIEQDYSINSFPTFLFFASDGNPVHKVVATKTVEGFIELGKDALDSNRQYYHIVKNFKPGLLDTTELKSLAGIFSYSDKMLTGKMAADYLNRIPKDQLDLKAAQDLMSDFQDNLAVHTIAIDFIRGFDKGEFGKETNLKFIEQFKKDSLIRVIAKKYIEQLTNRESYTNNTLIDFIYKFTDTVTDKGFKIFYQHEDQLNAVMHDNQYAQLVVTDLIKKEVFSPVFNQAKQTGIEPDFEKLAVIICKKYNKEYSERVVLFSKFSWYKFLVIDQKMQRYYPELIGCRIAEIKKLGQDTNTTKGGLRFINNVSYGEIFLHSNDKEQLSIAIGWMKRIVARHSEYNTFDTYACLLYKIGRLDEALKWEEKALMAATDSKNDEGIVHATTTKEKMEKGDQIWLEKEYQ
jgi:thioredoxin-related protein